MDAAARDERIKTRAKTGDQRTEAQCDADRLLYASAFRRLGGVTQVVLAQEGHLFHNRLTHSMKVAQIGRRLAEKLLDETVSKPLERDAITIAGGLDPETVNAAGLAHDLGHPPFGHIGEQELNNAVRRLGLNDGFEGNAQTFRIVTKLAVAGTPDPGTGTPLEPLMPGLNLARSTLNAILKYPWTYETGDKKWGVYNTEIHEFRFARTHLGLGSRERTLEAEIMDWSDDITYGVHDVEDFYRAGFVPLRELVDGPVHQFPARQLVRDAYGELDEPEPTEADLGGAVATTVKMFAGETSRFEGTRTDRRRLREFTSMLIGRFVKGTSVAGGKLVVQPDHRLQVEVLKSLTKLYVVGDPALATQQSGEIRIVRELFDIYWDALLHDSVSVFPARLREEAEMVGGLGITDQRAVRFVADAIASMTEEEAIRTHQRLTGASLGPLVESPMR